MINPYCIRQLAVVHLVELGTFFIVVTVWDICYVYSCFFKLCGDLSRWKNESFLIVGFYLVMKQLSSAEKCSG